MKFRNLSCIPKIIRDNSAVSLANRIVNFCREYDLVDLQYSTTTLQNGDIEYSVLVLGSVK